MHKPGDQAPTKVGNPRPVSWMFIAGTRKYDRVLLVGDYRSNDIRWIRRKSRIVHVFDWKTGLVSDTNNHSNGPYISDIKYSLVIINNLGGVLDCNQVFDYLNKQYLGEDAQVVLLAPNPYYFGNFLNFSLKILSGVFSDRRIKNRLRLGHQNVKLYEAISSSGVPLEAFPPGQYYTNSNAFLFSEKIKQIILNTKISRIFFNCLIYLFRSRDDEGDIVDECISEISKRPELTWESSNIRLVKIYLKYGKLIMSFTSREISKPEYLVVFPIDDDTRNRRDNEKKVVEYFNQSGKSEYFVKGIITGSINRMQYYAMEELPGITVDINNSNIEKMTSSAFRTLMSVTCRADIDQSRCIESKEIIVSQYLQILNEKYPEVSNYLERLYDVLNFSSDLPLVNFLHGDLKLENFIVDPKSNRVVKFIDMELAELPGPALLDLLYLITYNYESIHEESFDQVYQRLVDDNVNENYRRFMQEYCSKFGLTGVQQRLSLVLFFMHHYAKRVYVHTDNRFERREFLNCLEYASNILGQLKNTPHNEEHAAT